MGSAMQRCAQGTNWQGGGDQLSGGAGRFKEE